MKEKIIALLVAKFAGVRKDGLARLAGALSLNATTEEEAGALVEKLTKEQVDDYIKDYRKDVDKEVSESNQTYEGTLRKKYDFVEKKDPKEPGKEPKDPVDTKDIASIVAAELAKAVAPIQQELAAFKGKEVIKTRLQTLESKLKDVPETFKAQKLKDFGRMNFETDEAFNEYLTETEADITAFNQELANKGLAGHSKPAFGKTGNDGVSAATTEYIASKTAKDNPLGGKEV